MKTNRLLPPGATRKASPLALLSQWYPGDVSPRMAVSVNARLAMVTAPFDQGQYAVKNAVSNRSLDLSAMYQEHSETIPRWCAIFCVFNGLRHTLVYVMVALVFRATCCHSRHNL
jgi:hypothetical protein